MTARRLLTVAVATALALTVAHAGPPPANAGDYPRWQAALAGWLAATPGTPDDPSYRLALAQHELLRATGASNVASLAEDATGRRFLGEFLGSADWLEAYLASGPVPTDTPRGLAALRAVWAADQEPDHERYRHLATAVALVCGAPPTRDVMQRLAGQVRNPVTPASRYFFFKRAHRAGRLNPLFDGLRPWELRFVVGAPYDEAALTWALDHVNLPLWRYPDACWFVEYRGASAFGDTIQGPLFYMPWRESQNQMENSFEHGGVCGSLSTFGAVAAMAHGIPAYTVGQPGHCAYAVRFARGNWVGGFGGPAGSPHNYFWSGSYYYILLAEEMFADDATNLASARGLWAWRALRAAEPRRAAAALDLALTRNPANYEAWAALVDQQLAEPGLTPAQWRSTGERLTAALARHGRPLTDLLAKFERTRLWPTQSDAEKVAWFTSIHQAIGRAPGIKTWDYGLEAIFERQAAAFGPGADGLWQLLRAAVAAHAGSDALLGQLLEWTTKQAKRPGFDTSRCLAAVAGALQEHDADVAPGSKRKVWDRLLIAAEEARAVEAFHAASDAAAPLLKTEPALKLARPEGLTLVSGDALLYTSSTCGWDQPTAHRNVLRERGGVFHTADETDPFAVVQLRAAVPLTGVLLVNTPGNQGRQRPLKLSLSNDGKAWQPVWETDQVRAQWFVDLRGRGLRARWVKVESPHERREFFHLRNICVYGEQ